MSREIEFRGLKPNGEFVYGSLVNNCVGLPNGVGQNTKTWIVTNAFGNGGWFNIRGRSYVKPETVGQFTGLLDCNGVKIFEGDILKMWYAPRATANCQVIFNDGCFFLDVKNATPKSCLIKDVEINGNTLTVIGNIHQNSELLK